MQLVDRSGRAVPGYFAVKITLQAHIKNDYHVIKVTKSSGEVAFSRSEMEAYIADQQREFLMDYASRLDQCRSEVFVQTLSSNEVASVIKALEEYHKVHGTEQAMIDSLRQTSNFSTVAIVSSIQLTVRMREVLVNVEVG